MHNVSKQTKYKKIKKGKLKKFDFKANKITFGTIGLKALESGLINTQQIESSRQIIAKQIKKKGKIWVKICSNVPITTKPVGTRMGKGKGQISHWGARVSSGTILFEYCGMNIKLGVLALQKGSKKLPIKTKILM